MRAWSSAATLPQRIVWARREAFARKHFANASSLVAFGVALRTRDIGIRVALGATGGQIVRSVLSRELAVLLGGSVAGVVLGTGLYRIVTLVPFDLRPAGPSPFVVVSALLVCVGAGACVMPLARAMRVDPATVLRAE